MKKSTLIMMFAAAAGLASCTAQSPKANMKSDVDTLSYMMGVSNTQGLEEYAMGRLGIDSTHMADFVRGIEEGLKQTDAKQKAYMAGIQIGQQVSGDMFDAISSRIFSGDSTQSLSKENFLAGFVAAVKKQAMVPTDSAVVYVNTKAEAIKEKALETKYAARVKVNYKGTLIDGTQFDSSYDRKEPTTFRANQVIKGWTEALTMMPVGSKWELYIPQELAYGARETGTIKPFSTLIFEVELISIEKEDKK